MTRVHFLTRLAWLERRTALRQVAIPDAVTLMTRAGMTPDPWQRAVLEAPASRALWLCCRQSGKSSTCAVLALHQGLAQPGSLTLLLSPSLRQSQELFRKVQDAYRMLGHPAPLEAESALRYELDNGSRIIALPGTESTIRGYSGVDLLVIDEASRVVDELYYAVRPMLAVSGGRMVCLSTPWGKRGFFHAAWTSDEDWQRVQVTAEKCPRISKAFLAEERRTLPALWFQSEYMCEFVDTVDQVFASEDIDAAFAGSITPFLAREQ